MPSVKKGKLEETAQNGEKQEARNQNKRISNQEQVKEAEQLKKTQEPNKRNR